VRTPKWFVFVGVIFLSTAASILAQTPGWEQHPGGDAALEQITFIHGGAGPFAVAGYRIGERALKELKVPRGAFSLDVVHKTPNEVQWSCIADGVQAATGVSLGKLNLKLEETSPDGVETVIQDRKSGSTLVFRLKPEFVKRYLNLPPEKLSKAGKEVLSLPNDQIFSMSIPRTPSSG
jgi:formylmethanofuran dehydrogenase subunit E